MAFKLLVFAAFVAVARAGAVGYAAPAYAHAAPAYAHAAPAYAHAAPAYAHAAPAYTHAAPVAYAAPIAKVAVAEPEHYDPHPQYSFKYDVQDGLTGDSKSQHESRDGDVVHGSYSLIDADGTKRTVEYTADPHNGFNAVVHREPLQHVAKVAAPIAYAPVAKVAAPIAYAAGPAHGYYHH